MFLIQISFPSFQCYVLVYQLICSTTSVEFGKYPKMNPINVCSLDRSLVYPGMYVTHLERSASDVVPISFKTRKIPTSTILTSIVHYIVQNQLAWFIRSVKKLAIQCLLQCQQYNAYFSVAILTKALLNLALLMLTLAILINRAFAYAYCLTLLQVCISIRLLWVMKQKKFRNSCVQEVNNFSPFMKW